MVKVKCLACDTPLKLPEYIDTEDYDGEVVCQKCTSLLYIKLAKSKVRKYRVVEKKFRKIDISPEQLRDIWLRLVAMEKQELKQPEIKQKDTREEVK